MDFYFRVYQLSGFIILACACFTFLILFYSLAFARGKSYAKHFCAYTLFCLAFINGAVLADNLAMLLFFWEGLLIVLFGLIYIGNKEAFKTATKAFVIIGVSDLCMMAGIGLTVHLAGTWTISRISLPLNGLGILACALLVIGALAKAGCMPFHGWIPDAAKDAPLPSMALLPGALDKLLGIYLLFRICLDMFSLKAHSGLSIVLMAAGSLTIIFAVMMALIQKEYKRLLSYHVISQIGYMVLGIGTASPLGIIGGLFHMFNNAIYKSCLFLTAGSVEKQAGTTELSLLGGIGRNMPVTLACFLVAAFSISGVPPFNGFFSKELIYEAALERGWIFYLAAVLGSFFTAASFLKLGHAAFLGKRNEAYKDRDIKEAPWFMLLPMLALSLSCIFFGLRKDIALANFIYPAQEAAFPGILGMRVNILLTAVTVIVLAGAFLHHIFRVKVTASPLKAADDIHYAPLLSWVYARAEEGRFDLYRAGLWLIDKAAKVFLRVDRRIDWLYNILLPGFFNALSLRIRKAHSGYYVLYIAWSLIGGFLVLIFVLK